jgi:2-methylcitrate dehydratase PrpD
MSQSPTRIIAEKIVETGIDDAPAEAVRIAKDLVFDTVTCMLAGAADHGSRLVQEYAVASGPGDVTIAGTDLTASTFMAAMCTGTAAAILDWDDNSWRVIGHPSGILVPAAFALGEELGASGRQVLEAYIIGHETIGEVSMGTGMSAPAFVNGRHNTGTFGIFGATAVAAKLLDLDVEQVQVAFGIAGSCSAALRCAFGTETIGLHSGQAAANGIMSARLAATGFTAQTDVLERKYGFADVFLPGGGYDLSKTGESWANPWDLLDPVEGPGIKLFPGATTLFCAGECAMEIATRHNVKPDDITRIEWRHTAKMPMIMGAGSYGVPENSKQAGFSIPWSIANGLVDGHIGLASFEAESLKDPVKRALCAKVELSIHPDLETIPDQRQNVAGELLVYLKDGSRHEHMRRVPRTYPGGEPLTREQLVGKYREGAIRVLDEERMEALIPVLDDFDSLPDISALTKMMRTGT